MILRYTMRLCVLEPTLEDIINAISSYNDSIKTVSEESKRMILMLYELLNEHIDKIDCESQYRINIITVAAEILIQFCNKNVGNDRGILHTRCYPVQIAAFMLTSIEPINTLLDIIKIMEVVKKDLAIHYTL